MTALNGRRLNPIQKSAELFAGIGGFRSAADAAGISTVWANDVCPKACLVYRSRFGDIREGDLTRLVGEIPPHDLLTAGFPCQPFSSAGKKQGVRDPRGTLFQTVVDVLQRHQPPFFILENVKRLMTMERGFHFATILASLAELDYHVEWRLLNAMHMGLAQNRQRVFIIGVRGDWSLRVRLAAAEDFAGLSGSIIRRIWAQNDWTNIGGHGARFPAWGMARSGRFVAVDLPTFSQARRPVLLRDVLEREVPPEFDFTETTLKWLPANTPVNRFVQGVEILSNQGGGARMGYTIFGINGVAPTLTSTTSRHYERYKVGDRYRRLTNVEYARLQGFPDNHCSAVSVYDQYALLGNAVPPPLAGWVLGRINSKGIGAADVPTPARQLELFNDRTEEAADERRTPGDAPNEAV
jgi:DNA (cytosine-5)-methyltransferase 1